jgi:RimJ/RimL family protein N-acetyltransferase
VDGATMIVETPTLTGEKTRLRAVEEQDMPLFVRWFNDPEVVHWLASSERPPHTLQSQTAMWEKAQTNESMRDWIIETLDARAIGNAGLNGIERIHQTANFYITIGEKDCWNGGFGTDATRLVLLQAFEGLGLRRVQLWTDADNARAIRCYEKCGFVREGVLRGGRLRYGEPLDVVVMGVLREDWERGR